MVIWFYGWETIKVNYHPTKFAGHSHSDRKSSDLRQICSYEKKVFESKPSYFYDQGSKKSSYDNIKIKE